MKTRRVLAGGMGALVLGGLLLTGCGSGGDSAVQAQSAGVIDLSGVPPNWDKNLPAAQRFVVLAAFANAAVRDNETGLVWEQSPQTTIAIWNFARLGCINKTVGNRKGWRLPSMPELASLIDPSVAEPGPTLPPGHPFTNVLSSNYWSATTVADVGNAWSVGFDNGVVQTDGKGSAFNGVWCVRGGMNADQY